MTTTASPVPDGPLAHFLLQDDPSRPTTVESATHYLTVALFAFAVITVVAIAVFVARGVHRRHLGNDFWALEIALPPSVDIEGARVLWRNLHDLLRPRWRRFWDGQPHIVFEMQWKPELHIRICASDAIPRTIVQNAIEAAWPGAISRQCEENELLLPPNVLGGELRLQGAEWFPLKFDHDSDPLRMVIAGAAPASSEEGAVIQVLARPVTSRRVARCNRAARSIMTGKSMNRSAKVLDLVSPGVGASNNDDPNRSFDLQAVRKKGASLGWEVVVRYGVYDVRPRPNMKTVALRAHGLASSFALFSGRNRFARKRLRRPATVIAQRKLGRGDLLSVEELAAVAHLPTDEVLPGVTRAGAKSVAPGPAVASVGKVLGDSEGTSSQPVAIEPLDARYHLHVLGSTGSGKSTLLTNLILQDVEEGRGAVVIDPKGDLITDVLDRLPKTSIDRVVLLDPDEVVAPPTLNVLEGSDPDLAVDHLVGIFRRIFEAYWGPRTDDVLRSACLTLLREKTPPLTDVPKLLTNADFRKKHTEGLDDDFGLGGFWSWYEDLSVAQQGQVVGPVMNKLRAFLLRPFVRNVMGSTESSFDMGEILDGGLLLVRIPKGVVGDETSRLLGSFVVAKVWQAATARSSIPGSQRRDASLYVDECQNFLNLPRSFDEMLAEARGYGLSLVLAHQHLGQLSRELREAISSNARNKMIFNASPEDARILERHFAPELSAHDLANLGAYQAAVRVMRNGRNQPACTVRTRAGMSAIVNRAEEARSAARLHYGRTAEQRVVPDSDFEHQPALQSEYSQQVSRSVSCSDSRSVSCSRAGDRNEDKHARQDAVGSPDGDSDIEGKQ